MYSNYSQIPTNVYYSSSNFDSTRRPMPMPGPRPNQGDRIFGGFLGPFVLGGITGGLLAPAFYPRPFYPRRFYGPMYPPYYYRPF